MKANFKINKVIVTGIVVTLIFIGQCKALLSHQKMVNKRIHQIQLRDSEINMIKIEDNIDEQQKQQLRQYYNEINQLKYEIMPIQRWLGYIEASFLLYPAFFIPFFLQYLYMKKK